MTSGWIKLHRQILDHPIARRPTYAWLWTSLLLMANHQDKEFIWNGKMQICKAGQILTGRPALSLQTGIPASTIEDALNFLENQHQIRQEKTTKFRLITIVKWDEYQISDSNSDNKATTKRQQSDTNKKDKNVKNEKKYEVRPETETLYAWIQQRTIEVGIENKVHKKSLDLLVERYVGQIHMKVELDHYLVWMLENGKKVLNTSAIGNCFKRQKTYQKKQQLKILETSHSRKIGQIPVSDSLSHFTTSPFAQ